jgi:hypothetical protein
LILGSHRRMSVRVGTSRKGSDQRKDLPKRGNKNNSSLNSDP